jgi:hypothetical protein
VSLLVLIMIMIMIVGFFEGVLMMCATADRFVRRTSKGEGGKVFAGRVFGVDGRLSIRIHPVLSCPVLSLSRDHSNGFRELVDQSSARTDLAPKLFLFACLRSASINR